MKAITLTQPWATLVAIGAKKIETRGWATAYRGPLAIHAGKGLGPVGGRRGFVTTCVTEPFRSVLQGHSPEMMRGPARFWNLPQGVIIAVAELYDIRPTSYVVQELSYGDDAISQQELAFGDYSAGRYAWLLRNVQMLPAPIECRGALGLWEWQP